MATKWVPLEADPEIFNAASPFLWSAPLGLPKTLKFNDLFSLDPEFLQFIPQPVFAVLLLFPCRGKLGEEREKEEAAGEGEWKGSDDENKKIWWIKQTVRTIRSHGPVNDQLKLELLFQIGNACGSIGLLHSLLNLPRDPASPYALAKDSLLAKFYQETKELSGIDKAKSLDAATFFEEAHKRVAESGQSTVPRTAEELEHVDLHFISFVEGTAADGSKHVIELDGSTRNGPFNRGPCKSLLHDVARIVQEKYIDRAEGDPNFTLITLGAKGEDE
ncbi:hypothetical protein QFC21_000533 [Naganishia friedmannii]|uniref:Uncharacterized protein n=1 Tax=Naganishia friedmannii TaxID=89922 RepID=A0ACC2WDB8_9TREE|nr:hypothetical protein QFC21_000533 [Naganishia friedmannii]